jgi:hypothetical protein
MVKSIINFGKLLLLALIAWNCDGSTSSNANNIVFPEDKIDYNTTVQPFLKYNCGYSGCHSSYSLAAGLSIDDYFQVMSYPGFVIPTKPDESTLVQILESTLPHTTYIYRGSITANQKTGIRKWISEGALLIPKK